ncbi:MAG: hypothetical protein ACYCX4_05645 [Bacillota bacterium]
MNLFSRIDSLNRHIAFAVILAVAVALLILPLSPDTLERFNPQTSSNQYKTTLKASTEVIGSDAFENDDHHETILKTSSLSPVFEAVPGAGSPPEYRWVDEPVTLQYYPDKRYLKWLYPVLHQSKYIG